MESPVIKIELSPACILGIDVAKIAEHQEELFRAALDSYLFQPSADVHGRLQAVLQKIIGEDPCML